MDYYYLFKIQRRIKLNLEKLISIQARIKDTNLSFSIPQRQETQKSY